LRAAREWLDNRIAWNLKNLVKNLKNLGKLTTFFSSTPVLPRPAAFGGAEAAGDQVLQTRHEPVIPARPAGAGPRSQHANLLLIPRRQQRQVPATIPVAAEHVLPPIPVRPSSRPRLAA